MKIFSVLVDSFTNDRSDLALMDIIRDLYDFARSNPSPEKYLQDIVNMYEVDSVSNLKNCHLWNRCGLISSLQLRRN